MSALRIPSLPLRKSTSSRLALLFRCGGYFNQQHIIPETVNFVPDAPETP
jgi:hypothetical protein